MVTVDVRSRQEPFMITKPPFVTPGCPRAVRPALRRTVANLVLVVVGMLIMAYPLTVGAAGADQLPWGDHADPATPAPRPTASAMQSYEQRAQARRNAVAGDHGGRRCWWRASG